MMNMMPVSSAHTNDIVPKSAKKIPGNGHINARTWIIPKKQLWEKIPGDHWNNELSFSSH
jgi:hypothetical protein